jgi:protein-disulfide isomerase
MTRLLTALLACALFSFTAAAQDGSWYPIKGEDGSPVMNHRVPVELESQIEALPGAVVVGNPHGDVTVAEFYDLNCPYCRKAAGEIAGLLAADKELRLVLVPFPVLGIPSIAAGKVEFAAARLAPSRFHEFHRKIFAGRGTVNADRALAVTTDMGLASDAVIAAANDDTVTEAMKAHVRLGNALGLAATPAFVVKGIAVLGYPGRASLEGIIAAIRRCDKIVCD